MPNILVAYYSRTGTTKKVAEAIQRALGCDAEEIISQKNRSGIWGYLFSGKEATLGRPAEIERNLKNPADYDLIIIGTPIWSWNVSSPVRAYLKNNRGKFKNVAFFATAGGSKKHKAFLEMQKTGSTPIPLALMDLQTKEIIENNFLDKTSAFVHKIHTEL